jgi:hypothetical protein
MRLDEVDEIVSDLLVVVEDSVVVASLQHVEMP